MNSELSASTTTPPTTVTVSPPSSPDDSLLTLLTRDLSTMSQKEVVEYATQLRTLRMSAQSLKAAVGKGTPKKKVVVTPELDINDLIS